MNSKKAMFRGQVPGKIDRAIRLIAALQDRELGEILTEALEQWLKRPEINALVKKHNLDLSSEE